MANINFVVRNDIELKGNLIFEGATDNAFETTLVITDPTADRTITFPDTSGSVALTSDLSTYLTQASASTTYLTQTSGSTTYATNSNPIFTGNVNFLNASANFSSASVIGTLDVAEVRETVVSNSFSTNVMTANYNDGAIHYATVAPTANFTISLTNVPTTTSKSITMSFLVTQGATGYIPTTLNLNGSSQTIRWVGGSAPTPTSSAGKIDIFNFTLILAASNVVIASANLNI